VAQTAVDGSLEALREAGSGFALLDHSAEGGVYDHDLLNRGEGLRSPSIWRAAIWPRNSMW